MPEGRVNYVCGFAFDHLQECVLLIEKQKPLWQRGLWNGVGGKIEPDDVTPRHAMEREFREETGLVVPWSEWDLFVSMDGHGWHVAFMRAFGVSIGGAVSTTDERVRSWRVYQLPPVISNLLWLVPLALQTHVAPHGNASRIRLVDHSPPVALEVGQ